MQEVRLSQGKTALVDEDDFDRVNQFKWYACWDGFNWYARRNLSLSGGGQTNVALHQFILPGYAKLDHKNGNTLDCQKHNLRSATDSQNGMNRRKFKNCSSKFKGVGWHKERKKWQAYIGLNKNQIYLGIFESEEAAARAYDLAAGQLHGEFARLNFPIT